MFPPSPALSFVDSLDGIEDLEAYLDAQPALSQFPTPPPGVSKNGKGLARITATPAGIVTQQLLQNLDENPCSTSHDDHHTAATTLSEAVNFTNLSSPEDIDLIRLLLIRANLSLEILVIALNILTSYRHRQEALAAEQILPPSSLSSHPHEFTKSPSLLITSALSLAVSYTTDQPPPKSWWVQHVGGSTWPGQSLHAATLDILIALDWRLHAYSSSGNLQSGRSALLRLDGLAQGRSTTAGASSRHRLKVDLMEHGRHGDDDDRDLGLGRGAGGRRTIWENGQITPGDEEQSVLSRFPSRATSVTSLAAGTTTLTVPTTTWKAGSQFLPLL